MKSIRLQGIAKAFRGEAVLENINLTVPAGSFFALLGPSGCGKTTILRLIAGFDAPDAGQIFLGDEDITNRPIQERSVNTVFQHYALFPHLNVFDNVAFGLRIKGLDEPKIEHKVVGILRSMRLDTHLYKPIRQLSGGQQQRVALARAVVNEPDVLLLDEPLAALDLKLREKMLVELMDLQDQLKTTFVYVTHDQNEALAAADQLAIMSHEGVIEQVDGPQMIYEFPVSSFVAEFVGVTNIFEGTASCTADVVSVAVEGLGTFTARMPRTVLACKTEGPVKMSVRPEKIVIDAHKQDGFDNHVEGVVQAVVYQGRATQYRVQVAGERMMHVFVQNDERTIEEEIGDDEQVHLHWQSTNAIVLER